MGQGQKLDVVYVFGVLIGVLAGIWRGWEWGKMTEDRGQGTGKDDGGRGSGYR
jgi:hypothetical protein